ncbi:MAG: tetratricopeptide repeat protein [Magnetococcales bacterium]|nr:tetratricopeptide repeat protein [Magnetococcales bacterium]
MPRKPVVHRPKQTQPAAIQQQAFALYAEGKLSAVLTVAGPILAGPAPDLALLNLAAMCCWRLEQPEQALAYWQQAIRIQPHFADAYYNMGNFLTAQKRYQEAEAAYRQVLRIQPDDAGACNNLGNLLHQLQRFTEAEAAYREALRLQPGYAKASNNLGVSLAEQKRFAEAEAAYRHALHCNPADADTHNNLGNLLKKQQHFTEAEQAYRTALRLQPHFAKAYNNLGNLLTAQKQYTEAEAAFRQALHLQPHFADAHYNLGVLLTQQQRFAEAEAAYRAALRLQPDFGDALGAANKAARKQCQWHHLAEHDAEIRTRLAQGVTMTPFSLLPIPYEDGLLLRQASRRYITAQIDPILTMPPLVDPHQHPQRDRLRIGYLSADFHDHATTHLLAGVLEQHDRQRFALYGYSYGPDKSDSYRQRVVAACDLFRNLEPLADPESARQIADDGVDILVDLKGYTLDHRPEITARRPAPLLVNWLGYPGTLGHPRLADYLIGDPMVSPPSSAAQFSETLALLPHCYQPNDDRRPVPKCPTRQAAGLPEEGFVFCSFNQGYKMGPECFTVWCRLLQAVPGSLLWLLEPIPEAMTNLRREAAARGVDPDRLVFAPRRPLPEHLARLALADLALDTFPYTSHTTGSDALWCGVPLLTRMGHTFASRVAASLLQAVGLPELITENGEDCFALAFDLATRPDRLHAIRARLAANRTTHPLFATVQFTRDLERLYARMWQDHSQGRREMIVLSRS